MDFTGLLGGIMDAGLLGIAWRGFEEAGEKVGKLLGEGRKDGGSKSGAGMGSARKGKKLYEVLCTTSPPPLPSTWTPSQSLYTPPTYLSSFPHLGHLTNSILQLFNSLRLVLSPSQASTPSLLRALSENLEKTIDGVSKEILEYAKREMRDDDKDRRSSGEERESERVRNVRVVKAIYEAIYFEDEDEEEGGEGEGKMGVRVYLRRCLTEGVFGQSEENIDEEEEEKEDVVKNEWETWLRSIGADMDS